MGTDGIVILGMHRSGTSAVTGVLERLGCHVGSEDTLMPAQPDNPRGFGERQDVYEVNEAILEALGHHWSATAGLDLDRLGPRRARALQARAATIVDDLRANPPWLLKDPRLCLLLPFWLPLLGRPTAILVHRSPMAVARSLEARNDLPLPVGLALWEQHTLGLLESSRGLDRIAVSYDELLSAPEAMAEQLLAGLSGLGIEGLHRPATADIEAFVDESLRHHRHDPELDEAELPGPALALWRALLDGSALTDGPPSAGLSDRSVQLLLDHAEGLRAGEPSPPVRGERRRSLSRRIVRLEEANRRLQGELERVELGSDRLRRDLEEAHQRSWHREHENLREKQRLETALSESTDRRVELDGWLAELDEALRRIFGSLRWRTGSRLADLYRRLGLRSRQPDPAAHPRRILAVWRSRRDPEPKPPSEDQPADAEPEE